MLKFIATTCLIAIAYGGAAKSFDHVVTNVNQCNTDQPVILCSDTIDRARTPFVNEISCTPYPHSEQDDAIQLKFHDRSCKDVAVDECEEDKQSLLQEERMITALASQFSNDPTFPKLLVHGENSFTEVQENLWKRIANEGSARIITILRPIHEQKTNFKIETFARNVIQRYRKINGLGVFFDGSVDSLNSMHVGAFQDFSHSCIVSEDTRIPESIKLEPCSHYPLVLEIFDNNMDIRFHDIAALLLLLDELFPDEGYPYSLYAANVAEFFTQPSQPSTSDLGCVLHFVGKKPNRKLQQINEQKLSHEDVEYIYSEIMQGFNEAWKNNCKESKD